MTDEQKEKARFDLERSVDRMRDKLVEVCTAADDALKEARETESLGERWGKLAAAVGKVRSMVRPKPGTLGWEMEIDWFVDHEPRLRLTSETGGGALHAARGRGRGPGNPPFDSATGTGVLPRAKPMGDLPPGADGGQQQADDSKPAQKQGGLVGIKCGPAGIVAWCFDGCHVICEARELGPMSWSISGRVSGTERISAVVLAGKWATSTYVRFIRNALVAQCLRQKRKCANYAARRAAEATASVQQQEATASVQQQEDAKREGGAA